MKRSILRSPNTKEAVRAADVKCIVLISNHHDVAVDHLFVGTDNRLGRLIRCIQHGIWADAAGRLLCSLEEANQP